MEQIRMRDGRTDALTDGLGGFSLQRTYTYGYYYMHTKFQLFMMNMSGDMGKNSLQEKRTAGLTAGRTD